MMRPKYEGRNPSNADTRDSEFRELDFADDAQDKAENKLKTHTTGKTVPAVTGPKTIK